MAAVPNELLTNPKFLRYVAETATPEEIEKYGPAVVELVKQAKLDAERLKLQPKQQLAEELSSQVDELLYGGAAGGGKTHWLLVHMAKQMLDHPGNRGLILRRVFPALLRSIIPRAKAMYVPHWAKYNEQTHIFTFHNGSILELGTLQYEGDVENYQGTELGVVAFEEVTEFLESQVDYFKTRLRAPVDGVKPHTIATTNPGGIGHKWVKRQWVKPKPDDVVAGSPRPGEVWEARSKGDGEPVMRAFVAATLDDNPLMLERDPKYRNKLKSLTNPKLRKAMELGDWDAIEEIEGALWEWQVLENGRVYAAAHPANRRILAIDPADGDEDADGFGVTVAVLGENGHAYVEYNDEWHNQPAEMAAAAIELYREMGCGLIIIEKNHGGKWIPAYFKALDKSVNVDTVWAADGKLTRAEPIAAFFYDTEHSKARAHMVGVHPELEEQLTTFTGKPGEKSPDRLDSMVWALTELMLNVVRKRKSKYRGRRG